MKVQKLIEELRFVEAYLARITNDGKAADRAWEKFTEICIEAADELERITLNKTGEECPMRGRMSQCPVGASCIHS